MRCYPATVEVRAAEPGPEGQHELEACPRDHAGAVDLRVVEHEDRDTQTPLEGGPRVEAGPQLTQLGVDPRARTCPGDVVRRVDHDTVPDHPRHPQAHPVGGRQVTGEAGDGVHEQLRRERVRRRDPDRRRVRRPCGVEHRSLDAAAPAVDGERERGRRAGSRHEVQDTSVPVPVVGLRPCQVV